MSEDALANYIDARSAEGDAAPQPDDEETRALVGTVKLAESALGTPAPSEDAERESRERLVLQMTETTLSPKVLRGDDDDEPGLIERVKRWLRGNR